MFGEVLEGADPSPCLHQLGTSPAEVDQCFEEVEGEEGDEEEHEDYDEDLQEGVEQVPGGEGVADDPTALHPADPGAGHFSQGGGASAWTPGVGLDPTDLEGPRPPSPAGAHPPQDLLPGPGPPPLPLRPGETRASRVDQSVTLQDGSQLRISRRHSLSRLPHSHSDTSDPSEGTSVVSGEEPYESQYESFASSEENASHLSSPSPGPPPVPSPVPGPAPGPPWPTPPRPPPGTDGTPRSGGGIGQRINRLGKKLGRVHERWVVGKQHTQPGPAFPA